MNKLITVFTICLFFMVLELHADSALFINSTPSRAEIVIDDSNVVQKTPALLRNLSPGTHIIELSVSGYKTVHVDLELKKDEILIIDPTLEYQYIPMIFPTYNDIRINEESNNRNMLLLEDGTYSFNMNPGQISVTPIYPGQRIINGLNISIPILTAFSGVLTVNEIYNPGNTDGNLSVFTISSFGISAALIVTDIILYFLRNRFYKNYSAPEVSIESEYPEELFETAEEMFAAGKLDTSLYYLNKILNRFPFSDIYPDTLYKAARIKIIKGENDSAELMLKTLIQEYPLPDFYNFALKSLADIYYQNGKYRESLDQLDLIIFMEAGFSREEIDLQRYKILNKWYETDSSLYVQLKKQLKSIVNQYTNSPYYNFYVEMLLELNENYNDSSVQ